MNLSIMRQRSPGDAFRKQAVARSQVERADMRQMSGWRAHARAAERPEAQQGIDAAAMATARRFHAMNRHKCLPDVN